MMGMALVAGAQMPGASMDAASTTLAPLPVDPAVKQALAGVSAEQVQADIAKLVSFGTRSTLSSMDTDLPPGQGILAGGGLDYERV